MIEEQEPIETTMKQIENYNDIESIKYNLKTFGYCIVPNILTTEEISTAKTYFTQWKSTIPNHDKLHAKVDPHGIYKFHEVGHQRHAWYIRTNHKVQHVFKKLWNCDKLIVSFVFDNLYSISTNFVLTASISISTSAI